jgi:prevent-host-death family protein
VSDISSKAIARPALLAKEEPSMREVGAFEAKNKFGQLLDWVERGEEITITRNGREVGRLASSAQKPHAALRRIRECAKQLKLGAFDYLERKAFRDEGRP